MLKICSSWSGAVIGNPLSWAEWANILRLTPDERTRLLPLAERSLQ